LINPDNNKSGDGALSDEVLMNSFIVLLFLPSASNHNGKSTLHKSLSTLNLSIESGRTSTVTRLLEKGRTFENHYDRGELLGTGVSGVVYQCTNRTTNEKFAVKVIDKRKIGNNGGASSLDDVLKEAEMLRSLRHSNIIHLEDIFENESNIFLIMELSLGGDLFDRLFSKKYYKEDEARKVMKQILDAIAFLHSNNVAHRDLKPENILLLSRDSDVDVKITDFGLAKKLGENGKLKTICGTPQYFAPEVLQRKNFELGSGFYSLEADMWSLGVMLYVLLCGQYPFNSNTNITQGQYKFESPIWNNVSTEAKTLISQLLVVEASQRLTAKQALNSPWILENAGDTTNETNTTSGSSKETNENPNIVALVSQYDDDNNKIDTTISCNLQQELEQENNKEKPNSNQTQTETETVNTDTLKKKNSRKQKKSDKGETVVRRSGRKRSKQV
jgi:serine/threonine protein kinase